MVPHGERSGATGRSWLSAHAHVLIAVGEGATLGQIAARAGVNVFEARALLEDLRAGGYVRVIAPRSLYVRSYAYRVDQRLRDALAIGRLLSGSRGAVTIAR